MTKSHSEPSEPSHEAILHRVALMAIADARLAWSKATKSPTKAKQRHAYRACVFAAQAIGNAVEAATADRSDLLEDAKRIDESARKMLALLAADP